MRIWLFKPEDAWAYCGGGAAIIAETADDVERLWQGRLKADGNAFEGGVWGRFWPIARAEDYRGRWVLVADFEVIDPGPERIVMEDANYA